MRFNIKKKLFVLLLFVCTAITFICTPVSAERLTQLFYDGQWHAYNVAPTYLRINGEQIETDMPPVIMNDRSVVPARAVFEKLGADVKWDGAKSQVGVFLNDIQILLNINDQIALVNGKEYKMDVPAKIINDRTMIPARFVGETLGMNVDWKSNERLILIDNIPKQGIIQKDIRISNIDVLNENAGPRIKISADGEIEKYSSLELNDNPRLVIDIPNSVFDLQKNQINASHYPILQIRASQYEINPNTTRIVVDLKDWTGYKIELSKDKKQLYIDFSTRLSRITELKTTSLETADIVDINMDFIRTPNVFRLSNPDRIVIDIPLTGLGISERMQTINSNVVKTIRYGQFDDNTTRIVVDVGGQPEFELGKTDKGLQLICRPASYINVYYNSKDAPQFIIYSSKVAINYKEKYEATDSKYILSIPFSSVDIGNGRMNINDNNFDYIDIVQNNDTKMTDIIFKAKKPYKYIIEPKKDSSKTVIQITNTDSDVKQPIEGGSNADGRENKVPADNSYVLEKLSLQAKNRIVVLDPGHGGRDPGAIYQDNFREKDFNLDISLRAYSMLKDAGVKVYMTRSDDTYVELLERAEFANRLNASLFVSVHNNSMEDTSYDGTMTLYYPSSYSSMNNMSGIKFAQIMQNELIGFLGTTDRGLRERPLVVVLNKTKMPAVVAEIAFISNYQDRLKLKTEDFRLKAAVALCNGIIKALNETVR